MKKFYKKIVMLIVGMITTTTLVNSSTANAVSKKPAFNKKSITLTITNKKKTPSATLKVKNTKVKKIKWKISNGKIATIKIGKNHTVKIKAKKAGKATITCKVSGRKLTCRVTVKDKRKTNTDSPANTNRPASTTKPASTPAITPAPSKCEHNWVAKWAVYESEGDYPVNSYPCYCGKVFNSEDELRIHIFNETLHGIFDTVEGRLCDEAGIHGTKAFGMPSISVSGDTMHIKFRREYIEYYYCTKCNEKIYSSNSTF